MQEGLNYVDQRKLKTALELEIERLERVMAQRTNDVTRMQEDRDTVEAIAIYIRENYQEEIAAGQHAGLTLQAVVFRYLQIERNRLTRLPKRLWAALRRIG